MVGVTGFQNNSGGFAQILVRAVYVFKVLVYFRPWELRLTTYISSQNSSPVRWPHSPPYRAEFLLGLLKGLIVCPGPLKSLSRLEKAIICIESLPRLLFSNWLEHRTHHHTGLPSGLQQCWARIFPTFYVLKRKTLASCLLLRATCSIRRGKQD